MSDISRRDAIRLTTAGLACGASVLLTREALGEPQNPWTIEFIPKQAEAVSVIIDGQVWNPKGGVTGFTWTRHEGTVNLPLPREFAGQEKLRIVAVAHPWGRDAWIRVRHNGHERKNMEFSKEEDHEISR